MAVRFDNEMAIDEFNQWKSNFEEVENKIEKDMKEIDEKETNEGEINTEPNKQEATSPLFAEEKKEPIIAPEEGTELNVTPVRLRVDKNSMSFSDFIEIIEALHKFADRINLYNYGDSINNNVIKIGLRKVEMTSPASYEGEWIELVPYYRFKDMCAGKGYILQEQTKVLNAVIGKENLSDEIKDAISKYIDAVDNFVSATLPFIA